VKEGRKESKQTKQLQSDPQKASNETKSRQTIPDELIRTLPTKRTPTLDLSSTDSLMSSNSATDSPLPSRENWREHIRKRRASPQLPQKESTEVTAEAVSTRKKEFVKRNLDRRRNNISCPEYISLGFTNEGSSEYMLNSEIPTAINAIKKREIWERLEKKMEQLEKSIDVDDEEVEQPVKPAIKPVVLTTPPAKTTGRSLVRTSVKDFRTSKSKWLDHIQNATNNINQRKHSSSFSDTKSNRRSLKRSESWSRKPLSTDDYDANYLLDESDDDDDDDNDNDNDNDDDNDDDEDIDIVSPYVAKTDQIKISITSPTVGRKSRTEYLDSAEQQRYSNSFDLVPKLNLEPTTALPELIQEVQLKSAKPILTLDEKNAKLDLLKTSLLDTNSVQPALSIPTSLSGLSFDDLDNLIPDAVTLSQIIPSRHVKSMKINPNLIQRHGFITIMRFGTTTGGVKIEIPSTLDILLLKGGARLV